MTTDTGMIYFDGRHGIPVLETREISGENFNPMCRHLLRIGKDRIRAKIMCLGQPVWINIYRHELQRLEGVTDASKNQPE